MMVALGILSVVLTFGLAVFVHEFGHFIFARMRGVGVEAFAIGFGPKICAWTVGGTEYSLRWLPLGGFVRLHQMVREEAEDEEAAAREAAEAEPKGDGEEGAEGQGEGRSLGHMAHEDMEALYDKGLVTKLLVFTGGVFMNVVTATFAMALYLMIGPEDRVPQPVWIGDITEDSAAAEAGLRRGDYVIAVHGAPVENDREFGDELTKALESSLTLDGVEVRVRRGDEELDLTLPALTEENNAGYLGTIGFVQELEPLIGQVLPYSVGWKAGLKMGDRVLEIGEDGPDGGVTHTITRWSEMVAVIHRNPDRAVELLIEREGESEPIRVSLLPEATKTFDASGDGEAEIIGLIGFDSVITHRGEGKPFMESVKLAPVETLGRLSMITFGTFKVFADAFKQGDMENVKKNVGGPVVIANLTYNMAQKGFYAALNWFISLNLILAFMNILPIPVLDGGFIVLSFIESIMRRPVPLKILNPVFTVFVLCFLMLFILISVQDVIRLAF